MDVTTTFLAEVIGVYFLVMGLSLLIHPARVKAALDDVAKGGALVYFGGAMGVVVGMLVVLTHNVWTDVPAILVSLVGWLALIKGVIVVLAPEATKNIMGWFKSPMIVRISGIILVIVGAYLAYIGFLV